MNSTPTVITHRPADLSGVHRAMLEAARNDHTVLIRGAGTATDWAAPCAEVDAVLDLTGLHQLLAYHPSDMTVEVRAGMPLADLQRRLAEHGQWVALDAARVDAGATVGGLLATADAGPRRHQHGSLRDLVLGATVVFADGTVARSGGHVIKNVAGYDLVKLFSGSLGTLGVIAEVVLRVHPLPEASRTVVLDCPADAAFPLAAEVLDEPVEPSALTWMSGRLLVRVEGGEVGAGRRAERIAGARAGARIVTGADEAAEWRAVADTAIGADGDTVCRVGGLPSRFPEIIARLLDRCAAAGVAATVAADLGVGVHTVRLTSGDAAAHGEVLADWRSFVVADGGTMTLRRRRAGLDEILPAWGPPPPAVGLLRAVKREFDPDGRLGPGRFAPWF